MKKNDVEEIFFSKNSIVCKKYKDGVIEFNTTKIDAVNADLFFEKFGKESISRKELETQLNIEKGEKDNFVSTP
jgi:hypothetical protein